MIDEAALREGLKKLLAATEADIRARVEDEPALKHAFTVTLPGGQSIRVITAPFFLGNKDGSIPGTRQDGLSGQPRS